MDHYFSILTNRKWKKAHWEAMYLNYDWQTWPKCQFHTIFLELPDTLGVVEAEEQIVV